MSVSIQVSGAEKIQAKLRAGLVRGPASKLIRSAAQFAARETKSGAPDGAIAQSIAAVISPMEARVQGSGAALVAEFGRHPGTPPPPADALAPWASRHGLSGLEFVIARAISRRGIAGRFFMRRAYQKLATSELPRLTNIAAQDVADEWGR